MTSPIPAIQPIRGHMTLTPGGIEMFATLMHVLFAHVHNPTRVGNSEHHKNASEYIREHARKTSVDRLGADAATATYLIGYPGRPPLTIRVLLGKPANQCLEVQVPSGAWIPVDFSSFDVRTA